MTVTSSGGEPVDFAAAGKETAVEAVETLVRGLLANKPISGPQHFASSVSVAREVMALMAAKVLELKRGGASTEQQALWLAAYQAAAGEAISLAFIKAAGHA